MSASSPTDRSVTVSIVSHGQNIMVNELLSDIDRVCAERVAVVVTENVPDGVPLSLTRLRFPVRVIRNAAPRGYGANNNEAFREATTAHFCVCNPDIRLPADPFPVLIDALKATGAAVAGPIITSPNGAIEDSARRFPTAGRLLRKALFGSSGPDYPSVARIAVDWVGGMFMLFDSRAYASVGGFDERYFLYYEDVDLCRRLRRAGSEVVYAPGCPVLHAAQRASHRDPRLARIHLRSMLRFLTGL